MVRNLSLLVFTMFLPACDSSTPATPSNEPSPPALVSAAPTLPDVPRLSPTEELTAYGKHFAEASKDPHVTFVQVKDSMKATRVNPQDTFTMSLYHIEFRTADSSLRQGTPKREGDSIYTANDEKHYRWKAQVCSAELSDIMRRHKINFVYAGFGKEDMPLAQCQ